MSNQPQLRTLKNFGQRCRYHSLSSRFCPLSALPQLQGLVPYSRAGIQLGKVSVPRLGHDPIRLVISEKRFVRQLHYGFETELVSESLNRNMERRRNLKRNVAFIDELPYRYPLIQQAIDTMICFRDCHGEGSMFSEDFYSIPYEAIVLVLTVARSLQVYMIRFN